MPVSAEGLKALRTKLRITQEELGAAAGATHSAVAEWEAGRNPLPQRAFDALLSVMMSRITEPPPLTGNDIVKLRKNLGISQARLAEAVGVSIVSIGTWEKFGDRPLTREASAKVRERYAEELAKAA
jgi:DNA-binding transcriptional regulator YiaG